MWDNLEEYVTVTGLVIMTVITFANVLSRYFLHASLAYTEELVTNLFVWTTLFGSAIAARRGAHLGLSLFTDMLPRGAQRHLLLATFLVTAALYLFICWYGIEMVMSQQAMGQISPALNIPEWVLGLAVPFGCVLVAVRFVQYGVVQWRKGGAA